MVSYKSKTKKLSKSNRFNIKNLLTIVGIIVLIALSWLVYEQKKPGKINPSTGSIAKPGTIMDDTNLPNPPDGYNWHKCQGMESTFLQPKGWFIKEEQSSKTSSACFITKEDIEKTGKFETGISVNFNENLTTKSKAPKPSIYAKDFIDLLSTKYKTGPINNINAGSFVGYGKLVYTQDGITEYVLVIGNDTDDSLYIITYESPNSEWNEAWEIGKTIISNMVLADQDEEK